MRLLSLSLSLSPWFLLRPPFLQFKKKSHPVYDQTQGSGAVFSLLYTGFWCCVFLTLHRVLVLCFPCFTQGSGAVFSLLHRGFWCCVFLTLQITLFLSLSPLSSQCCSSCMIAQGSSQACMYSMKKAENLSYGLGKMMAV